jgi:hypothetical protein
MRNFIYTLIVLPVAFLCNTNTYAQAKIGCVDKGIRLQGEQLKHDFKAQGMEVYKDAMLGMLPKDPYPVAVQLNAKEPYQFVFVGSRSASKIYFELFDGNDKKIGEKVLDNPAQNNSVIYSFIPPKNDVYLVVLSQKAKGKTEVCGSFSVMQKAKNTDK